MNRFLLGGIAIATTLTLVSVPASSQGVYSSAHPRVSHGYFGHGPMRYQNRYRGSSHGQWQGYGYGAGAGVAALATGALVGGAIASQNQGYYPGDYPGSGYPVYSDPGYGYAGAGPVAYNGGDSVAYCEQTYRSYDPASGTYLGYDGFRHPCP